jgi:hypothetical protein
MVELKGTTKQIAWAETVREEIIDRVERHLEVMVTGENLLERNKQVSYLRGIAESSWWIDHRKYNADFLFTVLEGMMEKEKELEQHSEALSSLILTEKDLKKDEGLLTTGLEYKQTVVIKVFDSIIKIDSKKDCDLICILKEHYFKWEQAPYIGNGLYLDTIRGDKPSYYWMRDIKSISSSLEDKVAELGYILINEGFPVVIQNDLIRSKLIDGDFEKESRQWMYFSPADKTFILKWLPYFDESSVAWRLRSTDIYNRLKSFYGSQWDKELQSMRVPVKYYRELLNFCDEFDFTVKESATNLLDDKLGYTPE